MQISLKAARVNAGLTQMDASKAIGVDKSTLISWEKGKTAPTVWQVQRICDVYHTSIDYIFFPCNPL